MKIKLIAEIGLAVALTFLLDSLKLWQMPQGGNISLSMLPVFFIAFKSGWRAGVLTGLTFGLLHLFQSTHIYHPLQWLLDYPVAYGLLGFAGFLKPSKLLNISAGIFLGVACRFIAHFCSGILFIKLFLAHPPPNIPLYVAVYNLSYLLPELLIMLLLVPVMLKILKRLP